MSLLFFYSLILLLGYKVSRLGLLTHEEQVKAILELECFTKVLELQSFLGMLVYFQTFISYFVDWMGPLFDKLWKESQWYWGEEQEYALMLWKKALQEAPVLGYAQKGFPYWLYIDASDSACECTL